MAWNKSDFPVYTSSATNINVTGPGTWFVYATTQATVVLPPRAGIPNSDLAIYRIVASPTAAPVIVSRSSADLIAVNGSLTATSFVLNPGESVDMVNSGLTWVPLFGSAAPLRPLVSGKYYGAVGVPLATGTPTQDRLRLFPWVVPETATYDRIGSLVTTAVAASTLRWVIYRDGGGWPSTLLLDSAPAGVGVGDASTTGWKEATISQQLVAGRRVWLGLIANGGDPGLRTFSGTTSIPDVGLTSAEIAALTNSASAGVFQGGVTADPPATFTGTQASNVAPAIWLRKA
ncbi:hypothetical protein CH296_00310 [Rhodococcus sp. 14-2496-1d]|uniref:hypothetical protein n=1 Tax=Rhodococcus sp. 14-2496-1d TaxID=2023146 RepID=UPI000B9B6FF5|nr:hypothetical protein [Rhodococcus sp. 14-2496-1d]OZF40734.1 hypothetical protein CH296_00310 [Rhodococcus sp. 14-2496-1d]